MRTVVILHNDDNEIVRTMVISQHEIVMTLVILQHNDNEIVKTVVILQHNKIVKTSHNTMTMRF